MASVKVKKYTNMAIGMLQIIIHNRWRKDEVKKRQLASVSLTKMYIKQLEDCINEVPKKKSIKK